MVEFRPELSSRPDWWLKRSPVFVNIYYISSAYLLLCAFCNCFAQNLACKKNVWEPRDKTLCCASYAARILQTGSSRNAKLCLEERVASRIGAQQISHGPVAMSSCFTSQPEAPFRIWIAPAQHTRRDSTRYAKYQQILSNIFKYWLNITTYYVKRTVFTKACLERQKPATSLKRRP